MKAAFRAAPALGPTGYELTGGVLRSDAGWSLPLAGVEAVTFVTFTAARLRQMRLDLFHGGRRHSLGLGLAQNTDPAGSDDYRQFLTLAAATLTALEDARPGLSVQLGEVGRARLVMFALGLVAALGGIGLFVLALATGVTGARLAKGGGAMAALALLGLGIAWGAHPWRKQPRLAPRELSARFRRWLTDLDRR
ncbi:MAG TPA: hypothetical protein ENJ52_04560 [Aliiroseovarius sp.]|nr:hypothetical protein [Aliiroseovarius sp.]